jgi:hypothetical protein
MSPLWAAKGRVSAYKSLQNQRHSSQATYLFVAIFAPN